MHTATCSWRADERRKRRQREEAEDAADREAEAAEKRQRSEQHGEAPESGGFGVVLALDFIVLSSHQPGNAFMQSLMLSFDVTAAFAILRACVTSTRVVGGRALGAAQASSFHVQQKARVPMATSTYQPQTPPQRHRSSSSSSSSTPQTPSTRL